MAAERIQLFLAGVVVLALGAYGVAQLSSSETSGIVRDQQEGQGGGAGTNSGTGVQDPLQKAGAPKTEAPERVAIDPPAPPPPEVPRPSIEAMNDLQLWVSTERARIRAEADPNSTVRTEVPFGTEVVANAWTTYYGDRGPKRWYQVTTATGVSGWANADLFSTRRPDPLRGTWLVEQRQSVADPGWYVQVGAARSTADLGLLEERWQRADDCFDNLPNILSSTAFPKSRPGMTLLNYGPYATQQQAEDNLAIVKGCRGLGDAHLVCKYPAQNCDP
jgi:hypothetical protein